MSEKVPNEVIQNKNKNIYSILGGVMFSLITLLAGVSYSSIGPSALPSTPTQIEGTFTLSLMVALVAGFYLGVSIKKNDSNAYLLSTYFIITMTLSVFFLFRNYFYFYLVPPLFTVGIGFVIWNGNIDLDKPSGLTLNAISKFFLTVISASINSITIKPLLVPYIGIASYASYVWVVLVVFILIFKFISYYDNNAMS